MKRFLTAAVLALTAGAMPAFAEGFRVSCADLETMRSPKTGEPARLVVKNERATDVEVRVIRNNGAEISLGMVKGKSEREITTRMRYLFAIYEGAGRCVTGVRMTDQTISIIVK